MFQWFSGIYGYNNINISRWDSCSQPAWILELELEKKDEQEQISDRDKGYTALKKQSVRSDP